MTELQRPPAISVVIPTFQRRDLLRRAVTSVLEQTFQDFELIVVDGGSTDGTPEAMAALSNRVRYEFHPHRGASAARNAALALAKAPVAAFLDSDNRWLAEHLATLHELLARHPMAVLASTCPGSRIRGRDAPADARLVDHSSDPFWAKPGYISCVAVRREALVAIGGFDESLVVAEDTDLWVRLALQGPFCLLRRRTVVKQFTRGGLSERGRRSGAYTESYAKTAGSILTEMERRGASAEHPVARQARGRLQLCVALRAIGRADPDEAGPALAAALALLPELSSRPEWVARQVRRIGADRPPELLQHFDAVQALWPHPASDTALYLRAYAAALAVRCRRPRQALRLLRGSLRATTPGFVMRALPILAAKIRRRFVQLGSRGRESPSLRDGGEVAQTLRRYGASPLSPGSESS